MRQSGSRRVVSMVWSGVIALVALLVLGLAMFGWLRTKMNRQSSAKKADASQQEAQVRVASQFKSPSEEAAISLVKQALAVRETGDVERYFRPGAASSDEIVGFLTNLERADGPQTGIQWLSSMDANGLLIDGVLVSSQFDGAPRNRLALLTPDAQGEWKIDFEAFARSVRPPWQELLDGRASEGLVRVMVAQDSYFNGVFRDEGEWECYGMASPDITQILVGYCHKNSPQSAAMRKILASTSEMSTPGRQIKRATLEIRRPPEAESRQFEITRVLAEDWVLAEQAFDGTAP